MAASDESRAIASIRALSYITVVLIAACLPALGCRSEAPDPPPEVKSQAMDPEKTTIEDVIEIPDFEDSQGFDPNDLNDSPKKPGTPSGEPAKEK